ncbi:SRPBCC domain-containing protein [Streptomyces sp. NPDC047315]|uniref:SRPBCC domain-containing protein n=1 Tax=Streptomyces sp. NPDC047315 TaxID=3155142 RepID=UPI0033C0E1A0
MAWSCGSQNDDGPPVRPTHGPLPKQREGDDHVRIELHDDPAGCLLVFTHVLADPSIAESASSGWQEMLDRLVDQLDTKASR